MADEEEIDSFDNLDDLDWSDVEDELKANREQIVSDADGPQDVDLAASADVETAPAEPELSPENLDINFLLDVELEILVEVGHTRMLIEDLLQLTQASIIELDSLVGQPLEVKVNENLIAHGEVVVINEKFGIRISDIISPKERFAKLK